MADHDHIRSCNRGPGNIVGEDARKTRQSLSQTQTHSKKRKAELTVVDTCSEGLVNITKEIAGNGGVKAVYVAKRHKFAPKGRPIPPSKQAKLDGTFGDQTEPAEDLAKLAMPKYNVGPGNDIGTYLSTVLPAWPILESTCSTSSSWSSTMSTTNAGLQLVLSVMPQMLPPMMRLRLPSSSLSS